MRPKSALVFARLLLFSAFVGRAASAFNVQLFGGLENQDPNNPVYTGLATESLELYMKRNGLSEPHGVIQVTRVTTQVVAGLITRLDFNAIIGFSAATCHSAILEKPWENFKQIDVTCDYLNKKSMERKSQKMLPPKPCIGCPVQKDANNPKYTELAEESLEKYKEENGLKHVWSYLLRIMKVTEQPVAGVLTRIDFEARLVDLNDVICHSEIWEKAWIAPKQIKVKCQPVLYNHLH